MSGLTEDQWQEVEKRLAKIDKVHDSVLVMETKLGIKDGNGLFGRVKKLEEKPIRFRAWIPVIICVIMFLSNIVGWVRDSIIDNVKSQVPITSTITPKPTP